MDDFEVKYANKKDSQHLLNSIEANHLVKEDWTGKKYTGIDLDWNYEKGEVKFSMKGFVKKALKEYQYPPPPKTVNGQTPYISPIY